MNLPNKLTIFRVFLIPVFMILYLVPSGTSFTIGNIAVTVNNMLAAIVFIVASVTDFLDGHIARKNNIVTNFGKFMDPLADKLLVTAAICCMLEKGICPAWIVVIILAREFIVTGLRLIAASEGIVIAAGKLGKLKTVIQLLTIIVAIFMGKNIAVDILFYISAFITALSGTVYIIQNKQLFKTTE